ncbi:hypothetical protein [Acinetobacter sp. WCHAc060042]|uniref:hypothetical protein n=1 Tax=Acinetobacter sp. WCHAc060042 TaxID=2213016 RepID=UPI000DA6AFB1|nr:hypothetical protein [Acinetobacter sp. WCHAc060042]
MNLIEQLGGYETTKAELEFLKNSGNFVKPIADDLESTLLEYRRAHNIFEMGDYIIHDGELKVFAMWSNAIDGCAYIGYAYAEDGEMAHKDEFRHAGDEEIKAGKRLEVL